MAKDERLNATVRERLQYHLRTLLLAVTGVAVACVGLHYLGPANVTVWILVLGPACLVAFAVIMIVPAVAAHYVAKLFSEQAAGFFLVSVPAMVGLGSLFLVLHTPLSREMASEALANCFIWAWPSFVVMALLFFPLLVFHGDLKSLFEGLFRRRLPYNVLLTWAIICAFIFFLRCSGISHAWLRRPFAVRLEFVGMNLLLYLAGTIPVALASGLWRFVTDVGPMGKAVTTLAVAPWGYLVAALLYAILLSRLGWVE